MQGRLPTMIALNATLWAVFARTHSGNLPALSSTSDLLNARYCPMSPSA
jgi:hypothetical protein